ncbi:MAG: 4-hydroxy-tetrahydrodipicolinate synthase [Dehalococcoidales bacterium]|jgi:4-hydroxy-tetrahydrodipicolinate synthase|nr:4-hydroxy-tetrahydrodipicolinate synthase [Dehalococcoidales bacterium]MDD3265320.1 4-hydroxy-tetrahydrodipicolinate synthase [Dehalococcoidales bacterium]MDD4322942.1 4-hydroxy-tetrahydrodipicolinate synthase [Dehalococcoidales bacterium]MDD4794723.1 4-hydroxy-tetrahydrodipicolinate synthase [Dehalococcoidales bacterium]MDD5122521.1 4-hydroxy-tetrahydrodipicolinate synthase [Dehalococcoidales bacterium]
MKELGRLITAMVTPMKEDGSVDYEQAKLLANKLVDSGSDGVVVVGTTGESPTLIRPEELKLFAEIKKAIGDRASVIAGTGSNATAEAMEATLQAEEIGVDACLLVVPYYNKPSQEGLYQHFKTIASATKLPCILYNVPSRTVASLSAETTIRLSKIDNIIGTKEASGNFEEISKIIHATGDDFKVWSGNDGDTLPLLSIGAYGVISVVSHLAGKQMREMLESFLAGNTERAAEIHNSLMPLFKNMFVTANPCPLKYALNHLGFHVGKPRLPLVEPDEKSAAIIREALATSVIDLPLP